MTPKDRFSAAILFVLMLSVFLLPRAAAAQEGLSPAKGMFLVASRQIQDPRFQQSVVLLLSIEPGGAAGLIINKPSDVTLTGLFRDMRRPGKGHDRLYYGGPVEPGALLVLHRMRKGSRNMLHVLKGVYVSSDRNVLKQTLKRKRAGRDYRVFRGYAGWTVGQLQRELQRGDWHVVAADAAMVFHEDEEKVWPTLIRKGEEILVWERKRMGEWLFGRRLTLLNSD